MFKETLNKEYKDKDKIHKHIKLDAINNMNLNEIQIAYKLNKQEHINLEDLINVSIMFFVGELKTIISNGNEQEAINLIEKLQKEIKHNV